MPNTRTLHRAFVGGEVSPEMFGRVDDPRYQAGAARMRNFMAMPHGPAKRRPGLQYVAACPSGATASRVIPFTYSVSETFAIEMGVATFGRYLRLYSNGAPVTFDPAEVPDFLPTRDVYYIAPGTTKYLLVAIKNAETTSGSITIGTDTFNATAHGFETGDEIGCVNVTGSLPTASPTLSTVDLYYAIKVDANNFKIASSLANALAGTAIDLQIADGGTIWWAKTNLLADGDRFQFDTTAPSGVSVNTDYYVYRNTSITYFVSKARQSGTSYWATTASTVSSWTLLTTEFQRHYEHGDLVKDGSSYYTAKTNVLSASSLAASGPTNWFTQGSDYQYTVSHPYAAEDLMDVHFVQSNDVMTFAHTGYPVYELRRYAADKWRMVAAQFNTILQAPSGLAATRKIGQQALISYADSLANGVTVAASGGSWTFRHDAGKPHPYANGDLVYGWGSFDSITEQVMSIRTVSGTSSTQYFNLRYAESANSFTYPAYTDGVVSGGGTHLASSDTITWNNHPFVDGDRIDIYIYLGSPASEGFLSTFASAPSAYYFVRDAATNTFKLSETLGGAAKDFSSLWSGAGGWRGVKYWRFIRNSSYAHGFQAVYNINTTEHEYAVSAVDANGIEGPISDSVTIINNLAAAGAYNTLTWNVVTGATRYHVYKKQAGLFGYLGRTEELTFKDDFIAPDMGFTPYTADTVFSSSTNYPGAVAYFEQRRCFGGTLTEPQNVWMSNSGTENIFSYQIPVQADNRIEFQVAAREANTIRHMIPLGQLVLLTGAGEWRVTSIDNDALTPENISVRPQSYIGSSNVQPVVVNNNVVFAANRGGHIRELGYNNDAGGYLTGDLSLRATHLFDNLTIADLAYSKAPTPFVWCVSSNGRLLGMTYIPEEQLASWHWHDTDGLIKSVACIAEGNEDRVYVTVNRNGTWSVQRLGALAITDLEDTTYADAYLTFDGTVTSGSTMTVSGGSTWGYSDTLTLTASDDEFAYPGTTDVGDQVVLYDGDTEYRIEITQVDSATVAKGRALTVIPASLRNAAQGTWAFARGSFSGLSHLNSRTVVCLADGNVVDASVSGGSMDLDTPAVKVCVGVPYTSEMYTLPMALQVEALAQGRTKNVNKAWLRVVDSNDFELGPLNGDLSTVDVDAAEAGMTTGEVSINLNPSWTDGGQVHIRQTDPVPLTVVGMTLEISVGG